ncbi:hypothetical protein J6590_098425, partial [Homalodisca vitripennis]
GHSLLGILSLAPVHLPLIILEFGEVTDFTPGIWSHIPLEFGVNLDYTVQMLHQEGELKLNPTF